ncbi:MAG: tetratricopeptide repeat protein, partial [Acidobacteriota bacterium]
VACEACHGPGSKHVAWAEAAAMGRESQFDNGHFGLEVRLKDPGRGTWMVSPETGKGMRLAPLPARSEIETCARCHARRSVVWDEYIFGRPIMDSHRPALLVEGLYQADGQILEEVYVDGSFLQSRMYQKGVTCSDCHDPHSLGMIFPGDKVCRRCHAQSTFETKSHHFHQPGTPGAACVDCHMRDRNYMVVDPRHDHSMRIPRPNLTLEIGTPNACNDCHKEKSAQWSVDWVNKWYGPEAPKGLLGTKALYAARTQTVDAELRLRELIDDAEIPAIVRATALAELERYLTPGSMSLVGRSLGDPDPLVRMGALIAAQAMSAQDRIRLAYPLLDDPVRAVRVEATRLLAEVPGQAMTAEQRSRLAGALEEYRRSQLVDADRPEANVNLGWLASRLGNLGNAESYYRRAIELDETFIPAYVNLADLYRMQERDAEGEQLLRSVLAEYPQSAELHHVLGLSLVRLGRLDEALELFAQAVELQPDAARYAYVYAVALYDSGRPKEAIAALEGAHQRMPTDFDILSALVSYTMQEGNRQKSLLYAKKLLALRPGDADLQRLIRQIETS